MNKKQYFINAIRHGLYKKKDWIIDCFAITTHDSVPTEGNYPYRLITLTDGTRVTLVPEDDDEPTAGPFKQEQVTGGIPGFALFDFVEKITIDADSGVANYTDKNPVQTNYGTVLKNCILLCYPFGKKIPFQNPYSIKAVEKIIAKRFADEPETEEGYSADAIYPSEYHRYAEGVGLIRGCSYFISPSASPGTMTVPDELIKLRDELLIKHKDELHDPAIIALIAEQLAAKDRELMKTDPSAGFFTAGKLFDVVRMKMFLMLGTEPSLSDEVPTAPIVKSLLEGWEPEDLVAMFNGQRYGSYSRGKLTEFGGTVVKLMIQAFRDAKITEDDCHAKEGLPVKVVDDYINLLEGIYTVGSETPLTAADLESKKGQTIYTRTPMLCVAKDGGFCKRCVGDKYSSNPRSITIAEMTIGSIFMYIFMKAMHGKAMETRVLDVRNAFS